jgi:hypothetical protein
MTHTPIPFPGHNKIVAIGPLSDRINAAFGMVTRSMRLHGIAAEFLAEVSRSVRKHGTTDVGIPDGTGEIWAENATMAKALTDSHAADGTLTWVDILREEVFEAFAETDPALLRAELVQVGAMAAKWIESIDGRES